MPLERLDGLGLAELADVDHVVHRARREGHVVTPVHVQRGRGVEVKLLLRLPSLGVPDNRRLIHGAG